MRRGIDSIDKKIMELLQNSARVSVKEIASQVFLSSPAVAARIERLEKNNIITGYRTMLNPEALGYGIKAFVDLELNPESREAFYTFIEDHKNVIECNNIGSETSMLIETEFGSENELDVFVNMLNGFGKAKRHIVRKTVVEHRGIAINY